MIWLAAILAPLFAAAVLVPRATRAAAARVLVPLSALPALLLALAAPLESGAHFPWLLLGTRFGFPDTGRVLLALTALLWLGAGLYAGGALAADPRRTRFFVFFALALCGNLGLVAARDVASFYMFFALMTFSAYGLVVHDGDARAYRAGRIYLVAAVVGEVLLLAAILMAAADMQSLDLAEASRAVAASSSRDLIVLFAFTGFGIKAGAALVHFWLPIAHPVAPVPASAVLSGAMIKAGLIGWLHFLPFGIDPMSGWAYALVALGCLGAYGGALLGLSQNEPKTVLAYSSVSQMGLMTVVLGAALLDPRLWPAAAPAVAVFALNHGLAKGALFLAVGAAHHHAARVTRLLLYGGVALAALSIAGAPWTAGAVAKYAAKNALDPLGPALAHDLALLMSLASVATTLVLTRFLVLFREIEADTAAARSVHVGFGLLAAGVLLTLPFGIDYLVADAPKLHTDIGAALWPIAAGVVAYPVLARLLRALGGEIPPGDLVVLLERGAHAAQRGAARLRLPGPAAWQIDLVHYLEALAATERARDTSRRIELRLSRWENAGVAFIAVMLGLVALVLA